jgi:hypothetical protein
MISRRPVMKIRLELVVHVPDGTTEQDVRKVFHDAMHLYSTSASIHLDLPANAIARSLMQRRETLILTELTVLDDLAEAGG